MNKPRTKSQIKALLKAKSDELARVGNLKFDDSEVVAKGHVQSLRNEVNDLQDELDKLEVSGDVEWTVTPMSAHFGGMCWPRTSIHNTNLCWKMRYDPDSLTKEDQLWAASIMDAYFAITSRTNEQRNFVCNKLKHINSEIEKAKVTDSESAEAAKNPTLGELHG